MYITVTIVDKIPYLRVAKKILKLKITRKKQKQCVVMDVNYNCVNHFATSIKSLCHPPKTNTMLHVTFILVFKSV